MKPRTKITVEECPTLDVRSLPDAGYFDPSVKRGRLRLQRAAGKSVVWMWPRARTVFTSSTTSF